jgi:hypothetical protein
VPDFDLVLQKHISESVAFAKRRKGQEVLKMVKSGKVTDLFVEEFSIPWKKCL